MLKTWRRLTWTDDTDTARAAQSQRGRGPRRMKGGMKPHQWWYCPATTHARRHARPGRCPSRPGAFLGGILGIVDTQGTRLPAHRARPVLDQRSAWHSRHWPSAASSPACSASPSTTILPYVAIGGLVVWQYMLNTVNEDRQFVRFLAKTLVRNMPLPLAVHCAARDLAQRAVHAASPDLTSPRSPPSPPSRSRRWRCWPYRGCSWWCST